ncbi:hypothetical protein [Burkholderia sp. WSM2232]|uniref:hypothetical protein n=1 Tax=Burkholderia sp. WSM2232 TaxID=944436 RepID=UPI0012EC13BE|nr:hypothetical protein [Burkholderia sp. WSM2232]
MERKPGRVGQLIFALPRCRALESLDEKKARLEGRADKGLEIFFVNEKVRFGKQNCQYNSGFSIRLFARITILCCAINNNSSINQYLLLFRIEFAS